MALEGNLSIAGMKGCVSSPPVWEGVPGQEKGKSAIGLGNTRWAKIPCSNIKKRGGTTGKELVIHVQLEGKQRETKTSKTEKRSSQNRLYRNRLLKYRTRVPPTARRGVAREKRGRGDLKQKGKAGEGLDATAVLKKAAGYERNGSLQ